MNPGYTSGRQGPRRRSIDTEFRLGEWLVVPDRLTLIAEGGERRLEPKAMEALLYLCSRPGEVVRRDEMIGHVWKDTYGTDEVLSRVISILRNQLDDNPRSPRFIETIPKVGYRLLVGPEPNKTQPQGNGRSRRVWIAASIGSILAVTVLAFAWRQVTTAPSAATYTIAVVPFKDLTPGGTEAFLAVGLTDELIAHLSGSPNLRLVSRRSLANSPVGIDYYIDGNVMSVQDRIRVFVELTSALEGLSVWSSTYAGDGRDYLNLQRGISNVIAAALSEKLALHIKGNQLAGVDLAAYTHYLRGNFLS